MQVHCEQCCVDCILSESEQCLLKGRPSPVGIRDFWFITLIELCLYIFMYVCNQILKTQVEKSCKLSILPSALLGDNLSYYLIN